jgi:haloalkane dehalogenase
VHEVVVRYRDWLATSAVPKLFLDADPGSILVGRPRAFVRKWTALTEVTVPGSHFVPEDSPHEIGRALADWIPTLG